MKETDYRELGRDDTGYRAYHIILDIGGLKLEIQVRSQMQHYWSESIERTSVIYGYRLKEKEGDQDVINYFKYFSNFLYFIETKQKIEKETEIDLQQKREIAEKIIYNSKNGKYISGHVNEDIIKTMIEKEKHNMNTINNWILIFDWSDGNFVMWDIVGRNADEAVKLYMKYELEFPEEEKYEVVMIGSSDISTVPQTHSHYFGIDYHTEALEGMEKSIIGLSRRSEVDIGSRRILLSMKKKEIVGEEKYKC